MNPHDVYHWLNHPKFSELVMDNQQGTKYTYESAVKFAFGMHRNRKSPSTIDPIRQRSEAVKYCEDVGSRLLRCTLDNYVASTNPQKDFLALARGYAETIEKSWMESVQLAFYGQCGAGKDHALAGIAKVALCKGYSVRCINGPDFRTKLRDALDTQGELVFCQQYIDCHFLWISDPTIEGKPMSAYQQDVLYRIVDQRWQDEKPCWLSINARNRAQLSADLGEPVLDRLLHNAKVFFCDWETARKKYVG